MRVRAVVPFVTLSVLLVAFAGCTSTRDIESEAAAREEWAADHDDYDPVAVLTGPKKVAPGAMVFFSAHGSHDPDFFGANDGERKQATNDGGVHYEDDYGYSESEFDWYWSLDVESDNGLGDGIREYRWQVDDGPILVAHELTYRYGSNDGPIRLPVGFPEPGHHTIRLTVEDWSGDLDRVTAEFEVAEGGTSSHIDGWSATSEGWRFERVVDVSWQQYGACPTIDVGNYDATDHQVSVPWDLIFFMDRVLVEARWEKTTDPLGLTPGINLNDVDLTLGYCNQDAGQEWKKYAADTTILDDELVEKGEAAGTEFAQHIVVSGAKTERTGAWTYNAYLSDEGNGQWGPGTQATVAFTFVPATDTSYGGL